MELFKIFGSIFIKNDNTNTALESASKKADKANSAFGKMGKGMAIAGGVIGGATVGIGAALIGMAKSSSGTLTNINKLSQQLGMSTDSFQKWKFVLARSGVDIENMKGGMKKLATTFSDATKGAKGPVKAFEQLGLKMKDLKGKSQEQIFEATIKGLSGMKAGAERTALATKLLGKNAIDLSPLFNKGAKNIDEMKKKSEELGLVIDNKTIKAGAGLGGTLSQLNASFEMLKTKIGAAFAPVLLQLAQALLKVVPGVIKLVTPLLDMLLPVVTQLITTALPVFQQILKAIMPVIATLAGVFMQLLTTAILPLVMALMPLITAILPVLVQIMKEIVPAVMPVIKVIIDLIAQIVPELIPVIKLLITTALKVLMMMFKELKPVIKLVIDIIIILIKAGLVDLIKAFMPLIIAILPVLIELLKLLLPAIVYILTAFLTLIKTVLPPVITGLKILGTIVSGTLIVLFNKFTDVLKKIGTVLPGVFSNIKKTVAPIINFLIDGINTLIRGINKIAFKAPDWVPGIGGKNLGFDIPTVPHMARGGTVTRGGQVLVGENGPELLSLMKGATVTPLDKAGSTNIIIDRGAFQGAIILDDYSVDKLLDRLVQRLKLYGIRP
jgi:phage-related protein